MKFLKSAVFLILILCVIKVNSEDICSDNFMDMNNKTISDIKQYCKNKKCLVKCCGDGEVLDHYGKKCVKAKRFKVIVSNITKYNIPIYYWKGSPKKSNEKFDITFIQNTRLRNDNCSFEDYFNTYFVMEDTTLKLLTKDERYISLNKMDFCLEYHVKLLRPVQYQLIVRRHILWNTKSQWSPRTYFVAYGMLVSCFFTLLTLGVYCALPQLQNLNGLVLMGYLTSFFFTCLLRSISILLLAKSLMSTEQCQVYSPFMYFFTISSFCWLNIMSFDIFWTFRGTRKCREIHRRGEISKFKRYGLWGWGAPLLLTVGATIVNNCTDWPDKYQPPFKSCFGHDMGVFNYIHIPIIILIGINIILFFLTGYNIWMIKRAFKSNSGYRLSKKDENRFAILIKLAVLMGVNWITELLPNKTPVWLFIISNFFIVLMGVAIFFLFVFKKSILTKLCLRFNIKNKFVDYMQAAPSSIMTLSTKSSKVQKEVTEETTV